LSTYYNEIDAYAAEWLRNLIKAGHIAPGDVDERSIVDVQPDDLRGYEQCHFFAGIGGWSLALRWAGVPDDSKVWTGSCPCQPLSSAGRRKGHADERHLWPAFFRLISECKPSMVFGEQVASKDGREWLSAVRADLESVGYAVGASDLPAAGVGAPHVRQRLWWVADSTRQRRGEKRKHCERPKEWTSCGSQDLSDSDSAGQQDNRWCKASAQCDWYGTSRYGCCGNGGCKYWRVEPSVGRLAHGIPARAHKLRAYGNAIVPQVAAEFIEASIEAIRELEP